MDYSSNKTYSGKTQDVLLAEIMQAHNLKEAKLCLPFSDGNATISMKR